MNERKEVKSCESKLCCKSTASLNEEVKEELQKSDGSLKELMENDNEEQSECEDK